MVHPSILDTSIIDLLEADPRPSLIVALTPHPPTVVYTNPAFAGYPALLELITAKGEDCGPLWEWITGAAAAAAATESHPESASSAASSSRAVRSSFSYSNIYWTRSVVHEQMVVVGANEQVTVSEPPRKVLLDLAAGGAESHASPLSHAKSTPVAPQKTPERPPSRSEGVQSLGLSLSDPRWILPDTTPEQRPFLDDINSVEWAATPLGPMRSWHPKLEEAVNQILVDSRPIAVYWGPSYITIYNEAFSKLCGSKHPRMLGMPVQEAWAEAGQRLREAASPRTAVDDEWRFFVERESEVEGGSPWLEETYLKWSMIPILENNECLGYMHPVAETTSLRLWERRMKMLIDLGEVLVAARDVESYWEKAIQQLAAVEPRYDIPLAILYTVEDDPQTAAGAPASGGPAKICRLRGALGVPKGHPIAPPILNLRTSSEALSSSFRQALAAQHPTLLQTVDGSLPPSLLQGLHWRGFEDPCRAAVICPIRPTKDETVMGLLVLGLNPRRPYDNDYRQYISLLSQKLATSLASIVLLEEEARRGRNAAEQAAYDQAMLKEKLARQTKEANESMQMFAAVAEFVPVGMCFGDPQGNITYANDAWYKITGYPGYPGSSPIPNHGFLACVKEEDRPIITAEYEKLKTVRNVEFEFRVKPQGQQAAGSALAAPLTRASPSFEQAGLDLVPLEDLRERHVLATATAECAADGSVIRVLTCLTDVTAHKRTAELAVRRAQQAENLKRMAEFATVGMYDMDLDGRLLGANNVFFEMCGLQKVDPAEVDIRPWEMCVCKEDYPLLAQKLDRMVAEDKVQNVEVRLNTTWTADDGSGHKVVVPRWVQATLMPVRTSEGVIQSFTGCLSDVSLQKWQLDWEKERKEEAIESKRQQENFIDMTSHEMRNPLSAIIHCADAITATLTRVQELLGDAGPAGVPESGPREPSADDWLAEARELVENCIDNAETIDSCAQHQKRIVDDILTMSKLDSSLISITRVTVDPIKMVQEALKMFEVEARRVDINLSMVVDSSYRDLGIKYLDFDPSRLKQVLINLLTNALKFTKTGPTRNVTVAVSASLSRPTEATSKVQFIPRSQDSLEGVYDQPVPRNRASPVFLMFEVEDTGEGLTEEEKKSLFQRFVQASSRTHVKYGGSGLGLFISRRLTELQNGSIGVASQPGVGSTFAFYIEAYRPTDAAFREAEASEATAESALSVLRASPSLSRSGSGRRAFSSSTLSSEAITATSGGGSILGSGAAGLASPSAAGPSPVTSAAVTPSTDVSINSGLAMAPAPPPPPQIKGVLVVEDNLINQQITRRGLLNMGFTVDVANHGVECLDKLRRTDRYVHPSGGGPSSSSSSSSSPTLTHAKPAPATATATPAIPEAAADAETVTGTTTATTTTAAPKVSTSSPSSPPAANPAHVPSSSPFPLSVILMDIEMPVQDGLTCTRHIRELERAGRIAGGRIPIIAVSANARMEQILEAREAGCDDVLVKPYRMPELLERMTLVMQRVAGAGAGAGGVGGASTVAAVGKEDATVAVGAAGAPAAATKGKAKAEAGVEVEVQADGDDGVGDL